MGLTVVMFFGGGVILFLVAAGFRMLFVRRLPGEIEFPDGPGSALCVFGRHKRMLRLAHAGTWLVILGALIVILMLEFDWDIRLYDWSVAAWRMVLVGGFAGIAVVMLIFVRGWRIVRYAWGREGSWAYAYRWREEEKRFEEISPKRVVGRLKGLAILAYCAIMLPIPLGAAAGDILEAIEFTKPKFYAPYVLVLREGPGKEWAGYVVWMEGRRRKCYSAADSSASPHGDIHDFLRFPTWRIRRSVTRRASEAEFSKAYNMNWRLREYTWKQKMPRTGPEETHMVDSFIFRGSWRWERLETDVGYSFCFRTLDTGVFAVNNLTEEEVREAGFHIEELEKLFAGRISED